MVCIQCGYKTKVINSRTLVRANRVWRRRRCLSCRSVFTTLEAADYSSTWLVRGTTGRLEPFWRDKLYLSLQASCQHRPSAVTDATALTETVIKRLLPEVRDSLLSCQAIAATAQTVLSRFDTAAGVHYLAFHPATTATGSRGGRT